MNRQSHTRLARAATRLGILAVLGSASTLAAQGPRRPNILFISNEDMSPHLGVYGDPLARTPNLDRLATEAVRFTSAFTTAPVCAPSRAAIITGMYQNAIGAQHMRTSFKAIPEARAPYEAVPPFYVKAFPEYLRAAGYWTSNNVKTDYQFGAPFTVWDEISKSSDWRDRPDPNQPFFSVINLEVSHESQTFPGSPARRGKPLVTDPARVQVPPYYPDTPKVRRELARFYDDIADMDTAEATVRLALDTWGQLDILVCAHGILRERMIFNMEEDEWDGVVRTHLKGCFAPTKFASIWWRQQRTHGGRIIYFTSDAGVSGGAGQPNYSAAHAGKLGLMRSNARALAAYGVTCNVIAPLASTRMTDRGRGVAADGPAPSASAGGTPMDPKNVVPIIVWLASDEGGVATSHIFGASGHRISVYNEPVQERVLWSQTPMFDIDRLFEEWPRTLGLSGYPMNRMQGMAPPPPGAAAGS